MAPPPRNYDRRPLPPWLWPAAVGGILVLLLLYWLWPHAEQPGPIVPPADTATAPPDTTAPSDSALYDSLDVDTGAVELTPEDTLRSPADSAFIRQRQRASGGLRSASTVGLKAGASQYPPDLWCTPRINATTFNAAPGVLAAVTRKAYECGMSGTIVPPRRLFTTNGQNQGPFSMTLYKKTIDQYAQVLTQAFWNQYGLPGSKTLLGFQVFDDHKCPFCWGAPGVIVPTAQVAEMARYTKQKLGFMPRGVRIEPSLMTDYSGWQVGDLDYTADQWTKKKRAPKWPITGSVAQQKAWYHHQDSLGLRFIKTKMHMRQVSLGDIYPPSGPPITAQELRDYYSTSLSFDPQFNCANLSWKWESFFGYAQHKDAWNALITQAKNTPFRACWDQ